MPVENPESLQPPELAEPLARFELLLSAAVGFVWGPLLFHFLWQGMESTGLPSMMACGALTLALGWLGFRAPPQYFRVRPWERLGGGRFYERYFGIRAFKRWMSHGDWMNAWLRRRAPDYRVVRPTRADVAAYGKRTESIERAHLAWGLGALVPMGYAVMSGAYGLATLWILTNAATNVWPILLQRYNRARAERLSIGRRAAA